MTEPTERVVDLSVIPDFSMVHLNGLSFPADSAEWADYDMLADPTPRQNTMTFGPFYALIGTGAFNPSITLEWWSSEPPAIDGADVRGEGQMAVPDRSVTVNNTTGGFLGNVPLMVPVDRANVRASVLSVDEDEVIIVQLWPTYRS